MPAFCMRYESHRTIATPLLKHYCGETRPKHVYPVPQAVAFLGRNPARTAETVVTDLREGTRATKNARLGGRPPPPMVSVLIAGPPPWRSSEAWDDSKVDTWARETLNWLKQRTATASGGQARVWGWLHMDEGAPHIHAVVQPLDERGLLVGWARFQRGMSDGLPISTDRMSAADLAASMRTLQDDYHDVIGQRFGLDRGQRGSKRKHERPRHELRDPNHPDRADNRANLPPAPEPPLRFPPDPRPGPER